MRVSLNNLYKSILNKAPYKKRLCLQDLYEFNVLDEQETIPPFTPPEGFEFIESNTNATGRWDELQKQLFNYSAKQGTGRGEYSIAALLLSRLDPVRYEEFVRAGTNIPQSLGVLKALEYIKEKNMVSGGGKSYDVHYPGTPLKYESKETSVKKPARTGVKGKRAAKPLLDKIHRDINSLYEKYISLDANGKDIVNQFKTPGGLSIGDIVVNAHRYFIDKSGELPTGAIFSKDAKVKTPKAYRRNPRIVKVPAPLVASPTEEDPKVPKLSLLSSLVTAFATNPSIEEIVPDTAKWIKEIYNTDITTARILDARVRSYLNIEADKVDPKVRLSDFILICSTSIFRDEETFKKEVQNYFIPGTREHQTALRESLPVTGVFTVNPAGYYFTGAADLEKGIRVTQVTLGAFKIGSAETEEQPTDL
jgi:hypothetical protein